MGKVESVMNIKKLIVSSALSPLAFSAAAYEEIALIESVRNAQMATYELRIKNETRAQWLSPCLCALHDRRLALFKALTAPSNGQAIFAEDGYNGAFAEELRQNKHVYSVLQCAPGLTPPGAVRTEQIEGPKNVRLSCASMPVTTNDVLSVVNGVRLPKFIFVSKNYESVEWDLGSEKNDFSRLSMPLDSLLLIEESETNPVKIAENVEFNSDGRPLGVPAVLSPFMRNFFDGTGLFSAEGVMKIFRNYEGSDEFPAESYSWQGNASEVTVTRIR